MALPVAASMGCTPEIGSADFRGRIWRGYTIKNGFKSDIAVAYNVAANKVTITGVVQASLRVDFPQ